jgi:hypothetical protein
MTKNNFRIYIFSSNSKQFTCSVMTTPTRLRHSYRGTRYSITCLIEVFVLLLQRPCHGYRRAVITLKFVVAKMTLESK